MYGQHILLKRIYSAMVKDDMKILIRTLSSPTLLEDITQLDAVLATEGWQTLMTFTRESARMFIFYFTFMYY